MLQLLTQGYNAGALPPERPINVYDLWHVGMGQHKPLWHKCKLVVPTLRLHHLVLGECQRGSCDFNLHSNRERHESSREEAAYIAYYYCNSRGTAVDKSTGQRVGCVSKGQSHKVQCGYSFSVTQLYRWPEWCIIDFPSGCHHHTATPFCPRPCHGPGSDAPGRVTVHGGLSESTKAFLERFLYANPNAAPAVITDGELCKHG